MFLIAPCHIAGGQPHGHSTLSLRVAALSGTKAVILTCQHCAVRPENGRNSADIRSTHEVTLCEQPHTHARIAGHSQTRVSTDTHNTHALFILLDVLFRGSLKS